MSNMKKAIYTESDLGCHSDGALGEKHLVERLLMMLAFSYQDFLYSSVRDCNTALKAHLDGYEGYDWSIYEAVNLLNERCADGVMFELEAGDLILFKTDENEL